MRRCTFCNTATITADCLGDNCAATVCSACIDVETGLCAECAVEARRRPRPRTAAGLCACARCVSHHAALVADLAREGIR